MQNIKLTVAYDGSDYCGWQIQPGQTSIQGTLADVAKRLTQEEVMIQGAGRTDAGVHALGQVAQFRTRSQLTPQEFQRAFNALLPASIRVVDAAGVSPDFHPRFQATAKTYHYRIALGRVVSPFECRYVLHDPFPLDATAMAEAARLFEGEHDFTSFAASTGSEEEDRARSPIRRIYSSKLFISNGGPLAGAGLTGERRCRLFEPGAFAAGASERDKEGEELVYVVRGNSFLRYMVRKIVGTLLDVGRGRLAPEDIPALFEAKDRSRSGSTVAPHGLYLVSVEYPEE
ncbi:MAG: tRNA pseudouridine synthase A [Bryobacteraceae bacterium]